MDLTESIAPKSDQLDAVDLLAGPRTFTIESVSAHNTEQPFNFHLAGFQRVWRPGKSMRRVIVAAWGSDTEKYVGKKLTLYCDPNVQFGGAAVGGTRISHMTGIEQPLKVPLIVKRGQSIIFTVEPLVERDWSAELKAAGTDIDKVKALGAAARAAGANEAVATILARYNELNTPV